VLAKFLLEVSPFIIEIQQVRHVSNQPLKFIDKQIRLRFDHLVDNALVFDAEL
jgi:hypothetical protein